MDPNAALAELREKAKQLLEAADGGDYDVASANGVRMAELFEGLDEWIGRGGFLPRDWQK